MPRGRRPISHSEHNRRLRLYSQGLDDVELGQAVGLKSQTISGWRIKHGLPARKQKVNPGGGISYKEVLPSGKCLEMQTFLRILDRCAKGARAQGKKPNLEEFFKVWRECGHEIMRGGFA